MRIFIAMLAAVVLSGCAGSNFGALVPVAVAVPARPAATPASPAGAQNCAVKPFRRRHGYASFAGTRSGLLRYVSQSIGGTGQCAAPGGRTVYADLFWNAFNRA